MPLLQASVDMLKRLWGDRDHSDVAASLHELAGLLRAMGRLEEALPLLQASVDMFRRLFGCSHPTTLTCSIDLLGLLVPLGRVADARGLVDGLSDVDRSAMLAMIQG